MADKPKPKAKSAAPKPKQPKARSLPKTHAAAAKRGWKPLGEEFTAALDNHIFFTVNDTATIGIGPPIPGQPNGSVYCVTDPKSGITRCYPLKNA